MILNILRCGFVKLDCMRHQQLHRRSFILQSSQILHDTLWCCFVAMWQRFDYLKQIIITVIYFSTNSCRRITRTCNFVISLLMSRNNMCIIQNSKMPLFLIYTDHTCLPLYLQVVLGLGPKCFHCGAWSDFSVLYPFTPTSQIAGVSPRTWFCSTLVVY